LDQLAKASDGYGSAREIREAMARMPHFRDKMGSGGWRHLAEMAEQIAGFPRHISQHVGGMIIASQPLIECR
jgi:error-prone DNA polymerase